MSLKAIHVLLIGLSILLSFGFSAWQWRAWRASAAAGDAALAALALVVGVALLVYFPLMLRKLRNVSYL